MFLSATFSVCQEDISKSPVLIWNFGGDRFHFVYVALKLEFGAGSYSGLLQLDCYLVN